MKHYVIEMFGGTEVQASEEFTTEEDRDVHAKKVWAEMRPEHGDNVFKACVNDRGELEVYPYLEGDLP